MTHSKFEQLVDLYKEEMQTLFGGSRHRRTSRRSVSIIATTSTLKPLLMPRGGSSLPFNASQLNTNLPPLMVTIAPITAPPSKTGQSCLMKYNEEDTNKHFFKAGCEPRFLHWYDDQVRYVFIVSFVFSFVHLAFCAPTLALFILYNKSYDEDDEDYI